MTETYSAVEARDHGAMLQMVTGFWVSQIVASAADLSLAERLRDGPRTAAEVAAAEGASEEGTRRLMRACAGLGLLTYSGDGFAGTSLLQMLHQDSPMSLKSFAGAMMAPGHWQTWGLAAEAVRKGDTQAQQALGMTIFDYFAKNPAEGALFGAAMTNLSTPVILEAVAAMDLSGVRSVVDVGGADGAFVLELLARHPDLSGTVFDLPHAVPGARAEAERRGLGERLVTVPGDFFASVPVGGDRYLLKYILHDWDEEACLRILQRCREAMHADSRIVVVEIVLDEHDTSPGTLMDFNMLTMLGSRERTLEEFDALFARVGLRRLNLVEVSAPYHLMEVVAA
jgi:hypothetical protein